MKSFEEEFEVYDQPSVDPENSFPARFEYLPESSNYQYEPFVPVQEATDDIKTTESDLCLLNNSMAILSNAMNQVKTIDGAIKISQTMVKLIECRRKVKKLPYGISSGTEGKSNRGYEVLE